LFSDYERFFPAKLISDLTPFPEYVSENLGPQGAAGTMNLPVEAEPALSQSTALGLSGFYFIFFIGLAYLLIKTRSFD
jgi:hypothetical protein